MESKQNETFARIFFGTNAIQETWSGGQGSNEAATRQGGVPPTLVGPSQLHRPTSFAYIYSYTLKTSRSTTKPQFHRHNLLYPRDPILGPFPELRRSGNRSQRAPTMMCEQFTTDRRVHSYQLDGFFSLFGSQYKVLDSLRDLFDVILFAVCLSRSDELWVYDQDYL